MSLNSHSTDSRTVFRLVESNHWGSKGSIVSKFYEGMPDRPHNSKEVDLGLREKKT